MSLTDSAEAAAVQAPMHERRPEWLIRQIEDTAQEFAQGTEVSYDNRGTQSEYEFGNVSPSVFNHSLATNKLVDTLERKRGRKLDILDIGAGAGRFIARHLSSGHNAQGVSIQDYRKFSWVGDDTRGLPDAKYLVGDAHNLVEIDGLSPQFDLIVGRHALEHLVDPLSTIEQSLGLLRPGGMFLCNIVPVRASVYDVAEPKRLLDCLARQGFTGDGSYYHHDSPFLFYGMVVRASAEPLRPRLGVEYRPRN